MAGAGGILWRGGVFNIVRVEAVGGIPNDVDIDIFNESLLRDPVKVERLQALQKAAKDNGKVVRTPTLNHKKVYGPIQLTVDSRSIHLKTKNKENTVISIQDQIYSAQILNPEVSHVSEARYTFKGAFQHSNIKNCQSTHSNTWTCKRLLPRASSSWKALGVKGVGRGRRQIR